MEDVEAFQSEPFVREGRNAVLHRLNREATNLKGKKVMLNADDFKKTVGKWPNTPIIFAREHPVELASKNLAKALDEVGGKLLGHVQSAQVITEGSPRLVADFGELVRDRDFEKVDRSGKLEISPVWINTKDGPIPDHILLFEGDETHKPGDTGAMMFQRLQENPKELAVELFQAAKDFVTKERVAMGELEDLKVQVQAFQNTEKQKEAELHAFQEKVKVLEAEKAEKEKEVQAFQASKEKERIDNAFNAFMKGAPKGWTEGKVKVKDAEGKETEIEKTADLRNQFQADPITLALKLKDHMEKHQFQSGADGDENANGTKPEKNGSVGAWDYKTRKWKNE